MSDILEKFQKKVDQVAKSLNQKNDIGEVVDDNPYKFEYKVGKAQYYQTAIGQAIKELQKGAWDLVDLRHVADENGKKIMKILILGYNLEKQYSRKEDITDSLLEISELAESLGTNGYDPRRTISELEIETPPIPDEIRSEIIADLNEVKKCFDSSCYRSTTVLCGRVLETALHRKFYDKTGNDILETSPGIGLGKMIAKLMEVNVNFDPGITQQIHLINQVRVHSVHKKTETFYPTKQQAHAMVLYTIDVLKKLFAERQKTIA